MLQVPASPTKTQTSGSALDSRDPHLNLALCRPMVSFAFAFSFFGGFLSPLWTYIAASPGAEIGAAM